MAKILIVDDEQHILLFLKEALSEDGYAITTRSSGTEALGALEHEEFDLILVDLKLRDISGLEVMREAKKKDPSAVVIMLTGHGSLESAMEAIKYGAFDYLLKPISVANLTASINKGLERRQTELQQHRLASQARQFAHDIMSGADTASPELRTATAERRTAAGGANAGPHDEEIVRAGDVEVDVKRHQIKRGAEPLILTPTEFNLLVTLMKSPGRVLSCKFLVKQVHNYELSEFDARSMIRVHIKHLRHKIERDPNNPQYIINVRGLGYKFGS